MIGWMALSNPATPSPVSTPMPIANTRVMWNWRAISAGVATHPIEGRAPRRRQGIHHRTVRGEPISVIVT